MNPKIQSTHLEREAIVYVRQSSMGQVRYRLESQRRQYDLAERARGLGFARVNVIDEDMGRSGTGSQDRPGFGRLLAAVCAGRVGAVLALEASRLARNNRDWHHLIDLCAMTCTLVIDHDGMYDPTQLNDRLVLGLKGTMSEFEMNLLRQRAQESLRQKVRRGKVLTQVPIGYVRTDDEGIEMTPDLQVQQAVRSVFAKFQELGSIRQAFLWFRSEKLLLPTWVSQHGRREVVWRTPVYARLFSILKNPVYAGAFVYGRRRSRTKLVNGRARKTDGHWVPLDQWEVFIPDHHEGYISWEAFLQNQKQLESNAVMRGRMGSTASGAVKHGPALLSGLLRCGYCGRMLHATYGGDSGRRVSYRCPGDQGKHTGSSCMSFGGWRVDQEVAAEVLDALQPVGVQAGLDAWQGMQSREDEKRKAQELALEKARYESDRVHRRFEVVEPENRLVAGELERRWNEALQRVGELETSLRELDEGRQEIGDAERKRLMQLGHDLQQAWDHPHCPVALKKRILRTVLEQIVAWKSEEPPRIVLKLHWVGGAHTDLRVVKNRTGVHNRCTDRKVVDLIRDLAQVCRDDAIVPILNRLGYRTGTGNTWTESRVQHVRHTKGIPVCPASGERSWLTMQQAAEELNVSSMVIRRLLKHKVLPGRQVVKYAPWMIERKDLDLPAVRRAVRLVHQGQRAPLIAPSDAQPLLFSVSSEV